MTSNSETTTFVNSSEDGEIPSFNGDEKVRHCDVFESEPVAEKAKTCKFRGSGAVDFSQF
jgi:hypothetical protein